MNEEFKTLYDLHYNSLCRVSYRIVKNNEHAREVVQEVFIEFWNKRDDWASIRSIKAFLIASVYNRSLNMVQREKKFFDLDRAENLASESVEDLVNVNDLVKCLAIGVDSLPEKCRQIFILSREEEMTYAQIASHLGISIKTVENQMGIALKKLKKHFDSYHRYPDRIILFLL